MLSAYVEVLLLHLNEQRHELASVKFNMAKSVTKPDSSVPHFSSSRSFIKGRLCVSESTGSICLIVEEKLLVNRIVSTSGETVFPLWK